MERHCASTLIFLSSQVHDGRASPCFSPAMCILKAPDPSMARVSHELLHHLVASPVFFSDKSPHAHPHKAPNLETHRTRGAFRYQHNSLAAPSPGGELIYASLPF
ncbi:hypothetical protein GQ43DRAFT_17577 [Delitschia confertaspora ATCC 74209]|uniref:Uncharacterized protein n=1 Tax=Delitschia confertaspora ATCC 74209 TaxID=1513339 RepID=A0A9P4MQL2_9PLEO|nr:hypothetical protein GQ43DRAFT_17577 [Delitschia confertaspora ATCC 74209]